jgi:hypothetical protein
MHAAGHERTCSPYSRLLFHAYDWGFECRQMSDRIAEALMRLGSGIKLSRDITQRHTTIPAAKLDELYGRTPTPGLGLRQPNSYT